MQGETIGGKRWCHRIGKKLKFAFKESSIQNSVSMIRDLTRDFCVLTAQTELTDERTPVLRPSAMSRKEIEKFALVKTAARNLYDALASACTKHTEHQAHFSLQPTFNGSSPQVRFNIAFRQLTISRGGPSQPMWFTVESVVTGSIKSSSLSKTETWTGFSQSLKRSRASPSPPAPPLPGEKRQKKSVRFSIPSPASVTPQRNDPPLQNLCTHSNFCNRLQNLLKQTVPSSEYCIGFLENSPDSKHLVYLNSRAHSITTDPSPVTLISLRDIFSDVPQGHLLHTNLSSLERIRLAKQLAVALLQFHATPWLKASWCSRDVFIYGIGSNTAKGISGLTEPYVDVPVKGSHGPISRVCAIPC